MPKAPDIAPGRQCNDPVTCEFFDRCNPPRPNDHVGYLPRIHASAMEELEELGIESIRDIPTDFELTAIQRRAADCVRTGEPWYDSEALKAELATLSYPISYIDFESINPAVPRFTAMRPYQQVVFQFSVHRQKQLGAEPEHFEFLAIGASDPRRDFIGSLCDALGENGSIVVYNAGFESQRLSELAVWLPEFAERIEQVQSRLWDLLPIMRNHVYHPAFGGSFSLKAVLPALVPDMTYEGMVVADGQDAGLVWESLVRGRLDQTERSELEKALRAYCGQDTFALVRLVETLRLGC
jgi:hypothetical protein